MKRILVINIGSTSTKIAIYEDGRQIFLKNATVPLEKLEGAASAMDQLPYRSETVRAGMDEAGVHPSMLDMIVARGGPLPPHQGGAYLVNDYMIKVLVHAPSTEHESGLACIIGRQIAGPEGAPVIIYDGTNTDEMMDIARLTGLPEVPNSSRGHPLNARKAARLAAEMAELPYGDGVFIVAHFGGSISVSAHKGGRIIDMVNSYNGPMSPQRAGRLPTDELVKLAMNGKYTQKELLRYIHGKAGYMAYFDTQDARAVEAMIHKGDEKALLVFEAMTLQCAKGIAEMRISVDAPVDRIVLTGGLARSAMFTGKVEARVRFIAPVLILPGEFEMEALAEGALRVLSGQEKAKVFDLPPRGFASAAEFCASIEEKNGRAGQPAGGTACFSISAI